MQAKALPTALTSHVGDPGEAPDSCFLASDWPNSGRHGHLGGEPADEDLSCSLTLSVSLLLLSL